MTDLDRAHWKVLHAVMFKSILRSVNTLNFRGKTSGDQKKKESRAFIWVLVSFAMVGFWFALMVGAATSPVAEFLVLTFMSIVIFMWLMVESPNSLFSPKEFNSLGYLPISTSTYLASKVSAALLYIAIVCAVLTGPSLIVILVRDGVMSALGWMLSISFAGLFLCLSVICLYSLLVKYVSATKLHVISTIVQVVSILAIMSAYVVFVGNNRDFSFADPWNLADNRLFLMAPPYWFLSLFLFVGGHITLTIAIGALLAVLCPIPFAVYLATRDIDYFANLGNALTAVAKTAKNVDITLTTQQGIGRWLGHESNVAWRLAVSHLKYDPTLRNSILGFLPMIIVWMVMFIMNDLLSDPFDKTNSKWGTTIPFALFSFVAFTIMDGCRISQQQRASWIIFTTPSSFGKYSIGVIDSMFFIFVIPSLILFAILLCFLFDSLLHVLFHMITLSWLIYGVTYTLFFVKPMLPFTEHYSTTRLVGAFFLNTLLIIVFGGILHFGLSTWIYLNYTSNLISMVIGISVCILLRYMSIQRCNKKFQRAEFVG